MFPFVVLRNFLGGTAAEIKSVQIFHEHNIVSDLEIQANFKAGFQSVGFSDWTGSPLFVCENVAVTLDRMSHMTNILLSKIQSAWKILLSGNQPLDLHCSSRVTCLLRQPTLKTIDLLYYFTIALDLIPC